MKHEATLRQFFEDLERLDFEKVASYCAPDCRYEDVPVGEAATAVGPDAIRAKLEGGFVGVERLPTTIHEIAENGDSVLVERTEVWHHATGEQVALPVMAVFHFRAGQLVLWRDYWDMKMLFESQPAAWLQRMAEAGAAT